MTVISTVLEIRSYGRSTRVTFSRSSMKMDTSTAPDMTWFGWMLTNLLSELPPNRIDDNGTRIGFVVSA